jgi:PPOX class probable F420-dependent enzyme
MKLPTSSSNLTRDEIRAYAFLATTMEDGTPQVTPVWFDVEDDLIKINTARGRVKDRNMTARPNVAIAIMNLDEPYRYIQIRGRVVKSIEEGARDHIDQLARKYLNQETYPWSSGEQRVTYYIQPESIDFQDDE